MIALVMPWILLPALVGRYARQHDELVRTGWELAERLELERDLIGERTRLLERSRIAGDMLDSLGHELSLIALRAAALEVHPEVAGSAHKAAGELCESAARATDRLREVIGVRLAGGRLRAGPSDGGFVVTARLPLNAGAAATPPTSKGKFTLAQHRVRRSMLDAIWLPIAAGVVLLLMSYFHLYSSYRSVLDAEDYRDLRVGQSRPSVEAQLPQYEAHGARPPKNSSATRGAPPDPAGTETCLFLPHPGALPVTGVPAVLHRQAALA